MMKNIFGLNRNIFDFFDEVESENIHRIYPHKIFCNKKCLFYDDKRIYFLIQFIPLNMEVL